MEKEDGKKPAQPTQFVLDQPCRVPGVCKIATIAGGLSVILGLCGSIGLGELIAYPMLLFGLIALVLGAWSVVILLTDNDKYCGWPWAIVSLIAGIWTFLLPLIAHFDSAGSSLF